MWLTGISDEVREEHGVQRGQRKELHLASVEYLLDGKSVERVECPSTAWKGEGHAVRITVDEEGAHKLSMRVTLALPKDADPLTDRPVVLESAELEFDVDAGLKPWMLDLARASASTLLRDHGCVASATSTVDTRRGPGKAIDGLQSTNWLFKTDDAEPTLRLEFKKPLRAHAIMLQQAAIATCGPLLPRLGTHRGATLPRHQASTPASGVARRRLPACHDHPARRHAAATDRDHDPRDRRGRHSVPPGRILGSESPAGPVASPEGVPALESLVVSNEAAGQVPLGEGARGSRLPLEPHHSR